MMLMEIAIASSGLMKTERPQCLRQIGFVLLLTGKEACRIFTLWEYPEKGPRQHGPSHLLGLRLGGIKNELQTTAEGIVPECGVFRACCHSRQYHHGRFT